MSSPPTLYFPETLRFDLTFKPSRIWNTKIRPGPTGRSQRRQMQVRPKRQMHAGSFIVLDRGPIISSSPFGHNSPLPSTLTDDEMWALQMQPFLDAIAGQYVPFYIFDPRPRAFYSFWVGGWNGGGNPLPITWPDDLPFVLPFRGNWEGLAGSDVATIIGLVLYPVGGGTPVALTPEDFTINNSSSTSGLETVLYAFVGDTSPDAGQYYVKITLEDAHERIPVVMTSDIEDLSFETEMEEPWKELHFDCEEYFG